MTRLIVGLSITAIIVTCWALIAQTRDERADEAAVRWAAQMGRPDRDDSLSEEQYRLLGLQSMSGDPIALGQVVALRGRLDPGYPDALPILDSSRLEPLLRCTSLDKPHCAFIPTLLEKYQPMLAHYDALPIETRLPFNNLITAFEILVMARSVSALRVVECLHENHADCGRLLRNELMRTREHIAHADSPLEQMIGIALFNRTVEFVTRQSSDSNWILQELELPENFFSSALSLDIVIRMIKREFESQLLAVDIVKEIAENEAGSLVEQWINRASFHPNRLLNWTHSNYLDWIQMALKIELIATVDESRFEEIDPRLLERVFDFDSTSTMSVGWGPRYFLSERATAKSRLTLFDRYLANPEVDPFLDWTKNNDFGSQLESTPMQNGTLTCQRLPALLKTHRPPCIPAATTRSP